MHVCLGIEWYLLNTLALPLVLFFTNLWLKKFFFFFMTMIIWLGALHWITSCSTFWELKMDWKGHTGVSITTTDERNMYTQPRSVSQTSVCTNSFPLVHLIWSHYLNNYFPSYSQYIYTLFLIVRLWQCKYNIL